MNVASAASRRRGCSIATPLDPSYSYAIESSKKYIIPETAEIFPSCHSRAWYKLFMSFFAMGHHEEQPMSKGGWGEEERGGHSGIVNIGSGDKLRCVCLSGKSLSIYSFCSIEPARPTRFPHSVPRRPLWRRHKPTKGSRGIDLICQRDGRRQQPARPYKRYSRAKHNKSSHCIGSVHDFLHSMGFSFTTIIKPKFNCHFFSLLFATAHRRFVYCLCMRVL